MGLKLGSDVSDGGICVTVFATDDAKNVLVSADSNNAASGLRERIAEELGKTGAGLVELCTSDTHNFAARNRTSRGYFALGEGSGKDAVVEAVKKLSVTELLDSWGPLSDEDAMPPIDKLTVEPFDL